MAETSYLAADHYDRVTEAWQLLLGDQLHYGVFETGTEELPVATAALTTRMIDQAGLQPGAAVLDVGCGIGTQACDLVERFGVRVTGITTSEVGVDTARARAARRGLSDAVFEVRDGIDNRFPDGSFDCVWVLESSHLMRDRQRLLSECARVLRPGGRLVLCDLTRRREIPFTELRSRREEFQTLRAAFGDARMEPLAYYVDELRALGLDVDHTEDLTAATLPTFERWRANAARHTADVEQAIGADGLHAFVRSADILEAFWRDGTLGYGLLGASKPSTGPQRRAR